MERAYSSVQRDKVDIQTLSSRAVHDSRLFARDDARVGPKIIGGTNGVRSSAASSASRFAAVKRNCTSRPRWSIGTRACGTMSRSLKGEPAGSGRPFLGAHAIARYNVERSTREMRAT